VITTGPNPKGTVLCLHEFTARGALFQPLADQLAAMGWKVVAPDMPGRGQSQRLPSELYTWHNYVAVLAAVLRLHNVGPLVILGVGWGAMLGLGLENLWRPKPEKLILCDLPWV
jgi:pimeloyl-ACP methyl ester carboxylesterase